MVKVTGVVAQVAAEAVMAKATAKAKVAVVVRGGSAASKGRLLVDCMQVRCNSHSLHFDCSLAFSTSVVQQAVHNQTQHQRLRHNNWPILRKYN